MNVAGGRFDELRQLCAAAGDKASLAIAMAGLVMDHAYQGRMREASQLASEAMALIESLGDPTLTVGLSFPAIYAKIESGEWSDVLRWSQRVIDLADGDPSKGNFIFGSPLALAFTSRAMARYCLGRPGWRDDLRHGLAMARSADPLTYAAVVALAYWPGSRMACWLPMIARCVRSRMRWGLPNDPATIWRWPSPRWRWASRWCTAKRLRSVTADNAPGRGQRRVRTPCAQPRRSTARRRVRGAGEGSAWGSR